MTVGAKRILVGEIGRPHGVRGLVKLRSFTADPAAIASYGPLTDEKGERRFALTFLADGLARVEGVSDRESAARLTQSSGDAVVETAQKSALFGRLLNLRRGCRRRC